MRNFLACSYFSKNYFFKNETLREKIGLSEERRTRGNFSRNF